MSMMENPLDFSKRSRRGIVIFIILFLVVVLVPRFISFFGSTPHFEFSQTDFEPRVFRKFTPSKTKFQYTNKQKKRRFKIPDRKFDPNQYAPSDWMNLGLSQKQADLVVKFGKRGFYSHKDLQRVFVISEEFFVRIKDSLVYPVKENKIISETLNKVALIKVELNTASKEELLSIKGIGNYFAEQIIQRRNILRGYVNIKQLLEIYHFNEEKLFQLESKITVDPTAIQQFNLNEASVEELKTHPYFTWNVANSIVKLRTQLGGFEKIEDIKRSVLIDEVLFDKVKPYLSL